VTAFLAPLPVSRIWGVGAKAERRLQALGIALIGQLAAVPEAMLVEHFGNTGRHLWQLAHGHDERTVVPDRDAKSISTETTFAHDIGDRQVLRIWLLSLVEHLAQRLRQHQLRARTVELKLRSADFRTRMRSQVLPQATNLTNVLWTTAATLLDRSLSPEVLPLRLLGVGATQLTGQSAIQGELFDAAWQTREGALDHTVDAIRNKFGGAAIQRGLRRG
jgi:DNA polymerase-4